MVEEEWRDIYFEEDGVEYDYRGLYQVSNIDGRIKSLNYRKTKKERILKEIKLNNGYQIVGLWKNGKQKMFYVHRLVLHMFDPEGYFEGAEVDHINTDRTDNRLYNLRWCTRKENCNNPLSRKHYSEAMQDKNSPFYGKKHTEETRKKISEAKKGENYGRTGENHPRAKRVAQYDLNGNLVKIWDYAKQASEELGINQGNICKCCKGKYKTAGGFIWKYAEED